MGLKMATCTPPIVREDTCDGIVVASAAVAEPSVRRGEDELCDRAHALIREHKASPDDALCAACGMGDTALVACLITEFGANVAAKGANGWGPLHAAVEHNHLDVVRVLVKDFGADVGAKGIGGWAPLHVAAHCGHCEAMRVLVNECGASVDGVNTFAGQTPLHMTIHYGHEGAVRVLVEELGTDINTPDASGYTPLHVAAWCGDHEVVRLLGVFGADVEAKLEDGSTPLHIAAQHGRHEAARVLIEEFGADVGAKTNDGHTALALVPDCYRSYFSSELMRLLIAEPL